MNFKKKCLSGFLALVMVGSTMLTPALAKDFPDTTDHWAKDAISRWSDLKIVNGDNLGNFRPNDSITRAEVATVLDNMIGYEKQSVKVFSDVSKSDWFAHSISRLYEAKVITGYEDGTIVPNASITRQEAAVMLSRAFGLQINDANTSVLDNFADKDSIGDWATKAVSFMTDRKYIQGSDGNFRPTDPITRGELVTIVDNIVGLYANENDKTYTSNYGNKLAVVKANATFNGVVLGGAVISPSFEGKVYFNSGTMINGHLLDLTTDAIVGTSGATIASQESPNRKFASNINYGTGSYRPSYGGSGGSSGSSSSTKKYTITFDANGGYFDNDEDKTTYSVECKQGSSYNSNMPDDPEYDGYRFLGWYTVAYDPDEADRSDKVDPYDTISKKDTLYAAWETDEPEYGSLKPSTGDNIGGFGKDADELMTKVKLTSERTDQRWLTAKGTLNYINDYKGSSLNPDGHFIALTYTLPANLSNPRKAEVSYYHGSKDNLVEMNFYNFKENEKGRYYFTEIFYVSTKTQNSEIVFLIDCDGNGEDYDKYDVRIDLSELKLGENPVKEVTTEVDFAEALNDENVTTVVVNEAIALNGENAVYGDATDRKTVILKAPLTIPENGNVKIQNLDFETAEDTELTNMILSTAGDKKIFTFAGNTVKGCFETVMADVLSGTVSIINNTFLNTHIATEGEEVKTRTALTFADHTGENTLKVTHNTFEKYDVAVLYELSNSIDFKKNIFKDNTTDIKSTTENLVSSYAFNYFKDAKIVDTDYIISPVYTDEECETLNDNTNTYDAYVVIVTNSTDKKIVSLSELTKIDLAEETDALEITVLAKDLRDAISITKGENSVEGNLVTAVNGDTISIKIGEGEAKTVTIAKPETENSSGDNSGSVE